MEAGTGNFPQSRVALPLSHHCNLTAGCWSPLANTSSFCIASGLAAGLSVFSWSCYPAEGSWGWVYFLLPAHILAQTRLSLQKSLRGMDVFDSQNFWLAGTRRLSHLIAYPISGIPLWTMKQVFFQSLLTYLQWWETHYRSEQHMFLFKTVPFLEFPNFSQ